MYGKQHDIYSNYANSYLKKQKKLSAFKSGPAPITHHHPPTFCLMEELLLSDIGEKVGSSALLSI